MSLVDAIKRYLCNVASATSVRWNSLKLDGIFAQSVNTVSAAGAIITAANPLPSAQYTRVTVGTNGQGVYLPSTTISGSVMPGTAYTVTNNSNTQGAVIQVYPSNVAGTGTINGASGGAAGAPYQLAWGDTQTFINSAANTWFTITSNNGFGGAGPISPGTASFAVTPLQAGGTFLLPAAAGANTITIPVATTMPQGAFFRFIANAAGANSWAITLTTDTGMGKLVTGTPSVISKANAGTVATFTATCVVGDWVDLVCINSAGGTNSWHVRGTTSAAAGLS